MTHIVTGRGDVMEKEIGKCNCGKEAEWKLKFKDGWMWMCKDCSLELLEILEGK